jgi:SOS-response transcriptional repressor LexA
MPGQTAEVANGRQEVEVAKPKEDAERLSEFINRIDQRRQQLGLSQRAAAVKAGLSPSQIRTMRRQHQEGKQRGVSVRTVAHLAQALRTTPEWLISGTGQEEVAAEAPHSTASATGLHLAGAVGAGLWLEATSENRAQLVPVPADPRYPAQYQSAYEVRGTSTDRFARPGDFLIVVDRKAAGLPLRSGDIVIVARTKDDLREITARRFNVTRMCAPGCELSFESTDPHHNVGIQLPNQESSGPFTLGGIVVAVYRPLI